MTKVQGYPFGTVIKYSLKQLHIISCEIIEDLATCCHKPYVTFMPMPQKPFWGQSLTYEVSYAF
jgi:hypothetical protein